MARSLHKLSDVAAKAAKRPGRHSDGGGLYLFISPAGKKSWLFMWTRGGGKRREMGMGAYPTVSLARARQKAAEARQAVEEGRDPIADKKREAEPTFGEAAAKYIASVAPGWRNDKHAAQWAMTLGDDYCKAIRPKRVSQITTDDVLAVLSPIWMTKNETASRLRGRIERVLDFAKTKGWRTGENPAAWRGHLRNILPKRQKLQRGHHPAKPYEQVPAFMARLAESEAMAARALEHTIRTAARSGETLGARWDEFDLDKALWTVPAERMKAGVEHVVPLAPQSVAMLTKLHDTRISDFVFPGEKPGKPLSNMAMQMLMRRMKVTDATPHGFRSSFRDWAGDETSFPREVAQAALAHKVGDDTERAYRRGSALEKRRTLMAAWSDYLDKPAGGNVVRLSGARRQQA